MECNRRALRRVTGYRKITGYRPVTIRVTCHRSLVTPLLIAGMILFLTIPDARTQPEGIQHASNFSSVEYFEPPHQQQMKSRLSGTVAQPEPGGILIIKQLKLETFTEDGKSETIVNAPECIYDTFNRVASSAGHLTAQTGDGKFHVEGDGFLWRQSDSFLIISNNVQTVIFMP